MSKLKPILFNTDMVRAILDGRKTVTRRLIKPQPTGNVEHRKGYRIDQLGELKQSENDSEYFLKFKPRYQPGDILYVRETWNTYCHDCISKKMDNILGPTCKYACGKNENGFYYKATDKGYIGWIPSIHMPKEAARIFLKVTDVRVERLQDITWQQAAKEGCQGSTSDEPDPLFHIPTLNDEFKKLWDSTIKKSDIGCYGWDANPWVWVIEFERCEKPE